MTGSGDERVYYVVEMTVAFASLAEVQERAADTLAEHRARSMELHHEGEVLMAGAFVPSDGDGDHLQTMAICRSHEAAERFVSGDPFVRGGQVLSHRIRVWANMFARPAAA